MAHFAEIDENNIVTRVLIVGNEVLLDENDVEQESLGIAHLKEWFPDSGTWVQTSYGTFQNTHMFGGTPFRGNYAGVGMRYNPDKDRFEHTQPFYPSWVFDDETGTSKPPIDRPGEAWWWDEDSVSWKRGDEPPWHRGWDDNNGWDVGDPDMESWPGADYYWDGDKEEWIAI
jgi:hypothetical protein